MCIGWKGKRSSIKVVRKNTVKIDPSPCLLLSALGHTPSPSCRRQQRWLNTQWTVTHWHAVIIRCLWVTAVGTGRTQCWLQVVSGCYLSIAYHIPRMLYRLVRILNKAAIYSACNFITVFVTISNVHCYTLQTFALTKIPSPLVCFCPHWDIPLSPPCGRSLWMTPNWKLCWWTTREPVQIFR